MCCTRHDGSYRRSRLLPKPLRYVQQLARRMRELKWNADSPADRRLFSYIYIYIYIDFEGRQYHRTAKVFSTIMYFQIQYSLEEQQDF